MKKYILFFLLALLPLVASAYDAEIGGIYYNFYGDEASVTYRDDNYNSYSGNVIIPNTVTYNSKAYSVADIGEYAFYGCSGLTSITIPNSVYCISFNAFRGCSGLTSITIPNSVMSIDSYAFCDCSGLTFITLPNSALIGDYAFRGCSKITDVCCYAEEVPWTDFDVFQECPIGSATLHVPAKAIEQYRNVEPWNQFKEIIAIYQCAKPTFTYKNGKLYITCETDDVEYVYTIATTNAAGKCTDGVINLGTTFTVSMYATRFGYYNSETETLTIDVANVVDVNGDGLISIADVTALVNLILGRN